MSLPVITIKKYQKALEEMKKSTLTNDELYLISIIDLIDISVVPAHTLREFLYVFYKDKIKKYTDNLNGIDKIYFTTDQLKYIAKVYLIPIDNIPESILKQYLYIFYKDLLLSLVISLDIPLTNEQRDVAILDLNKVFFTTEQLKAIASVTNINITHIPDNELKEYMWIFYRKIVNQYLKREENRIRLQQLEKIYIDLEEWDEVKTIRNELELIPPLPKPLYKLLPRPSDMSSLQGIPRNIFSQQKRKRILEFITETPQNIESSNKTNPQAQPQIYTENEDNPHSKRRRYNSRPKQPLILDIRISDKDSINVKMRKIKYQDCLSSLANLNPLKFYLFKVNLKNLFQSVEDLYSLLSIDEYNYLIPDLNICFDSIIAFFTSKNITQFKTTKKIMLESLLSFKQKITNKKKESTQVVDIDFYTKIENITLGMITFINNDETVNSLTK